MQGKWKPYCQIINDTKMYIAGRQKNMSQPLHSGNVEYTGGYSSYREAVVSLCNILNAREGENPHD